MFDLGEKCINILFIMFPQILAQCLTQNRNSREVYWMNEQMNEAMSH